MDATTQITTFQEFLESHYMTELLERIRKGKQRLVVDFDTLASYDPELANILLEEPENTVKAAEIAVEQLEGVKGFNVRFRNLPASQHIPIRELRSEHLGKFVEIEGIVRQKSDVRPQVTSARFECPSCGNIISVLQLDTKFREPDRCGCGRKGKFRLLTKELVDAQRITLEESPDNLEGGEQPKRLAIFVKKDLVAPITDRRTNPGAKVVVTGYLMEIPIPLPQGGISIRYDIVLEANHIEPVEEDYTQINISSEEEEEIHALAKQPNIFEQLTKSLAPSIFGHDKIKEALVLQMLGGVKKRRTDGVVTRGDMHILLVGDPGSGKCVTGDTHIMLGDGSVKSIQEVFENTPKTRETEESWKPAGAVTLPVLDLDGRMHHSRVTRLWKRKTNDLLRIRTASGNVLTLTPNHPVFTTWSGFITSVPADMITEGMPLATPSVIPVKPAKQRLDSDVYDELDTDLSRLLGMLCGDGCLTVPGAIDFTNGNQELLTWYQDAFTRVFGEETREMAKKGTSAKRQYRFSKKIYAFLQTHFPELLTTSGHKNIPSAVLRSPNDVLASFIAGLFDTDGTCSRDKREVSLTTKSERLARTLKFALLRYGIQSRLYTVRKRATNAVEQRCGTYWTLSIQGSNAERFANTFTLLSDKLSRLPERRANTNVDVTPNVAALLREVRQAHGYRQHDMPVPKPSYRHYEKGDRNPSRKALQRIAALYNNSEHPLAEVLRQIAHAHVFWDPVVDITRMVGDAWVYDIEVEHVHNFLAESCIIHNSQLLKRGQQVAPKSRFVSGKGASGAGLTASVVRDEFIRGWALEAGALVLANKGQIFIDELDKMSQEDRSAFHEALEQQQVTISKANIQATLRAETIVLAAANPKFGRFDPYELLAKQIELPSTLINRFDLIFPVRDLPSEEKDRKMADFILHLHQTGDVDEVPIATALLTKYISYARSRIKPVLSDEAVEEISKFYVDMRNAGGGGEGISAIPISARQLEALVRLSEASARSRLSKLATREDAQRAINLVMHCLSELGMDPDTGKMDIDRLTTGVTAATRNQAHTIKSVIRELADVTGDPLVPEEEILSKAAEQGVSEEKAEEILEKLNRLGDIFRPKPGYYSMMK